LHQKIWFSQRHIQPLYDQLALVIAYDLIGLYECLTCIFQMLLQNEAYVLPPVEATWSKQQDKQHLNKKSECTPKCKGMHCAKHKAKLELEWINNKKAKKWGFL